MAGPLDIKCSATLIHWHSLSTWEMESNEKKNQIEQRQNEHLRIH